MGENEILNAVQLFVDSGTAEKIREAGIAEIVLRRKDKKFNSFIKARIADNKASSEAKKQIMNAALNNSASDGKIAAGIRKSLNSVNLANARLNSLDTNLKAVSTRVENVFKLASNVKALSFINIGLSSANIAVDIAGFVIIANEMKGLSDQVNQIAEEISKIKEITVEDMRSSCEKLYLDYNSFVTKIHDEDKLDRDKLEDYLKQAKPFISKLIRLLLNGTVDAQTVLNMIFTLLPAYTSVLCFFLLQYYFEKQTTPLNYDSFLEVYQEINSDEFRESVQDYYMIKKGFNYRDVIDILNVQLFTVFNERLEIDDQLKLLEVFGTEEAYFKLEKELEEAAVNEVKDRTEEIAEKCGEYSDECRRVLQVSAI